MPPARASRSMQTGQNSIAPENSLPQLGQVRLGSVLMGLTVLRTRLKLRKANGFLVAKDAEKTLGSNPGRRPGSARLAERTCRVDTSNCGTTGLKQYRPLAPDFG